MEVRFGRLLLATMVVRVFDAGTHALLAKVPLIPGPHDFRVRRPAT